MMKYDVAGRTVAITGAGGGLGGALAEALRARKANVALLDINLDAVTAHAERLGGSTVSRGWRANVRDLASLEEAMQGVVDHFGRLDVVIAAAGVGDVIAPLSMTDEADWERVIDINLNGIWRTFKAAAPYVEQQQGHLMAIASLASFSHSPLHSSYTASKAAVWGMCDSLRLEFRHLGVTVGSVHPTFFKTPMVDVTDPVALKIWGNFEGQFALIPLDTVIADILRGIERRSAHVVSPRKLAIAAVAPGLIQKISDRSGYPDSAIREAIELVKAQRASSKGSAPN